MTTSLLSVIEQLQYHAHRIERSLQDSEGTAVALHRDFLRDAAIAIRKLAAAQQALEQAQGEVPPSYRTDYPTSAAEIGAENEKAKADERLYGVGFSVNGWHVPAAKVACWGMSKSTHPQATEPAHSTAGEQDMRDAQESPFEAWWDSMGQYGRAGGSGYEKTFAWNAWCAALLSAPSLPIGERQRFEAWLRSKWEIGSEFPNTINGVYTHGEAQRFWVCWQAAARTQPVREPLTDDEAFNLCRSASNRIDVLRKTEAAYGIK